MDRRDLHRYLRDIKDTSRRLMRATGNALTRAANESMEVELNQFERRLGNVLTDMERRLLQVRSDVDGFANQQYIEQLKLQVRAEITRNARGAAAAEERIVDLERRLAKATGLPVDEKVGGASITDIRPKPPEGDGEA